MIKRMRNRIMGNPSGMLKVLLTFRISSYLIAPHWVKARYSSSIRSGRPLGGRRSAQRVAQIPKGRRGEEAGGERQRGQAQGGDEPLGGHGQAERQCGADRGAETCDQPEWPTPASRPRQEY